MFGNLMGWIISAVIVLLAVVGGREILLVSQPTAASGWVSQTVKPLGLDDAAIAALPPMNNLKDEAGDLYRQAAADYERSEQVYDSLQKARELKEIDYAALSGIDDVLKAGTCPSMDLLKSKPQEAVGFANNVMVLVDLEHIATAMENVVVLAKFDKQYDLARKYAEALQVLGYHLYKERVAYDELSAGETIMGTADALLISLDEEQNLSDKRAAEMQLDAARLAEYKEKIDPVHAVMAAYGPQNLIDHAGDYYQMAADPTIERVWRVEAIRRVGRLHFNAENKADQMKSRKFLGRLAADSSQDQVIHATATAAVNMTEGDNQCTR